MKEVKIKNKEGVVVVNRNHKSTGVRNQFDKSSCNHDIVCNNFFEESRSSSVVLNDERGEKIT